MSALVIDGDRRLNGEISVQGSKNAILPLMAASILCEGTTRIYGCPQIRDVSCMIQLLRKLGCQVSLEEHVLIMDTTMISNSDLDEKDVNEVRASILFLGALIARTGYAKIRYPGGCSIGKRPVDYHLRALRQMNIRIDEKEETIECKAEEVEGKKITLPFPSVGATEQIIITSVLAKGVTWIGNAAREPEVVELCQFLRSMGARIEGEGTENLIVQGVDRLTPVSHTVSYDRIAMMTYGMMVAGAGGNLVLHTGEKKTPADMEILSRLGCHVRTWEGVVSVRQTNRPTPIYFIKTRPYPGFATDLQPMLMAALTVATGNGIIEEAIFENRLKTAETLRSMGADIEVIGNRAYVVGVKQLNGQRVYARDLRDGAALAIAGLIAEGTTRIENAQVIQRGYEQFADTMHQLGAVVREDEE